VLIALQVALLTWMASQVWFFADDWDFLLTRGTVPGESRGWFEGHNGHWSTAVVAVYRSLYWLFGLEHYMAYAAVLIGMHVGVCVLVFRILLAVGTPAWTAVVATALVVFSGVGSEAMMWIITLSLLGSLLCGLAALSVWLRARGAGWRYPAVWALLVVGLMFSGGGITSVALVAVFAACHSGIRRGLLVLAVPLAAYVTWYAVIGHADAPGGPGSVWESLAAPRLVWTGLASFWEVASGIPSAGAVLLLLLLLGAFILPGPEGLRHLAWSGVIAAVVNGALIAFTRLAPGDQSRYRYVVLVLLLPALTLWLLAISRALARAPVLRGVLASVLVGSYLVHALYLQHDQFTRHRDTTEGGPALLHGILASLEAGEQLLTPRTGLWFDQDFRADLIDHPDVRGRLPDITATQAGRLDAERRFFVAVDERGQGLPGPSEVVPLYGFPDRQPASRAECRTYRYTSPRAVLRVPTSAGVEFSVRSRTEQVTTRLTRDERRSDVRVWPVSPGKVTIATSAKDAELEVVLERDGGDGTMVICVP
jgi:hypothetical protein